MNNHKNGLHLSINHGGRVSLWDDERASLRGKEDGEITVLLALTPDQELLLKRAQVAARPPRRGK